MRKRYVILPRPGGREEASYRDEFAIIHPDNGEPIVSVAQKAKEREQIYTLLFEFQGGACAICRTQPSLRKRFAIDHCHKTGYVRGLLCDGCNRGIGFFKEETSRLQRAIAYLRLFASPEAPNLSN